MVRLALVAALALGVAGCNTSNNYFQEEVSDANRDTSIFGSIMTMTGVAQAPDDGIEYRTRAPLAIPGSTELQDPDSATAAEERVNFPVDDDTRQKRRQEELRGMASEDRGWFEELTSNNGGERLSAQTMGRMRVPGGGRNGGDPDTGDGRLSLGEMKIPFVGGGRDAILDESGKPKPRANLLEPPEAYRTPAETAALPERARDIENSQWVRERVYSVEDRRPIHMRAQPQGSGGATQYQGPGF